MAPRAARVLLGFGFLFAAVALTLATAWITPASELFETNTTLPTIRHQLIALTLGAFVAAVAMGAALVARERERAVDALGWLVRLLCPLLLLPLLSALTQRSFGTDLEEAELLT